MCSSAEFAWKIALLLQYADEVHRFSRPFLDLFFREPLDSWAVPSVVLDGHVREEDDVLEDVA